MINYIDIPYRTTAVADASVVGWSEDIASGRSDADVFMLKSSIRFRVPPITNAKAVTVLAQLAPLMVRISDGAVRRSDGGYLLPDASQAVAELVVHLRRIPPVDA